MMARPFRPGTTNFGGEMSRLDAVSTRVIEADASARAVLLKQARELADSLVCDIEEIWTRHYEEAAGHSELVAAIDEPDLQLLLGAYFTQLYAYEAAALTNPSIVPVGETASDGSIEFVASARAIGEGHISSIAFLSGTVSALGSIVLDARARCTTGGTRRQPEYERAAFVSKLAEMGADNMVSERVMGDLGESFSAADLDVAIAHAVDTDLDLTLAGETLKRIHWLASSNYLIEFGSGDVTQRVISPAGPAESRGMEDARFVRFVEEDGSVKYYATYTAFDGMEILPQLIETTDFARFRVSTLSGAMARHKGIALFPRRIDGLYFALSRHDQESTFIMRSNSLREWRNAELAFRPERGWEAVQGGNCGSPMETEHGWLLITHGVGPMRRYVLSAVLLDLAEPTKVIGRLPDPLLGPEGAERIGYVPNVLYSCGSMIHNGLVIIPYGFADWGIKFASVSVDDVIAAMV